MQPGAPKFWFRIALFNLLLVAGIGVMMRYAFVDEIPLFNYKNWLHAHSHLAMLGWVYLALYALLVHIFFQPKPEAGKRYRTLFWTSLFTAWGMFLSFIIQGYGTVSIVFLVLHVLLCYVFIGMAWKDLSRTGIGGLSVRLLRMALIFLFISTLGLWALPVLIRVSGKGSEYYYMAIQFFLHFQLNGWFTFGVLAIFFRYLEERQIALPRHAALRFFQLLTISCFLTYALAVAWSNPLPVIFFINGTGIGVQFIALISFCVLLYQLRFDVHRTFGGTERIFVYAALGCFVLKILIQTAVIIPELAKVGYTIRGFVIGFMHLILLGVITMGLFGFAIRSGLLSGSRFGGIMVLIGFLVVELLLFIQGLLLWASEGFMPYYHESLTAASVLIFVGVLWMLVTMSKGVNE